jgi:hydrogenase maturation protein HypF
MGRLFDGIASLCGLCHHSSFSAQAAMALEYQVSDEYILAPYYYEIIPEDYKKKVQAIDWRGIVKGAIEDIRGGKKPMVVSTRFHLTLIKIIIDMAHQANKSNIVLTGGCFQNRWLLENAINRLKQEGFTPYWHKQVPCNDGGISLGQMYVAANKE